MVLGARCCHLSNELLAQHAGFEPRVVAGEDALGEAVAGAVGVVVEGVEETGDFQAREAGEKVGEFHGLWRAERMGAAARGGEGEKLGAEIDEAPEQDLLAFELRAEARHRMKQRPRQFARGTGRPADMAREAGIE